jgi:protein TonB
MAAREGVFGKKLKEITVTMVPKPKPPEPPKEKPPEPKVEPPKPQEAPKPAVAPPKVEPVAAPPPAPVETVAAPAAPAAVSLPSFAFSDGAKEVQTITNPNDLYKALVEHALLSRWNRPEDIADENFVAELEVSVDSSGNLGSYRWISGSGNQRWDNSVKETMGRVKALSRPPPKGFPATFNVRFDVESQKTEALLSVQ